MKISRIEKEDHDIIKITDQEGKQYYYHFSSNGTPVYGYPVVHWHESYQVCLFVSVPSGTPYVLDVKALLEAPNRVNVTKTSHHGIRVKLSTDHEDLIDADSAMLNAIARYAHDGEIILPLNNFSGTLRITPENIDEECFDDPSEASESSKRD